MADIRIGKSESGVFVEGGLIGGLDIRKSPITKVKIRRLADKKEFMFDSFSGFQEVECTEKGNKTEIVLKNPLDGEVGDFQIVIVVTKDGERISWKTSVVNNNDGYSVLEVYYPLLSFSGEKIKAFLPRHSGAVVENIIENEHREELDEEECRYPRGSYFSMQHFAFYNEEGGIYAAPHDGKGSLKKFAVFTDKAAKECTFICTYPAEGMGEGANSFELPGEMVWQDLKGDWYDATEIYGEFIHNNAQWIPQKGRPDTPAWFKQIPFWIMDWAPNLPDNPDPIPIKLRPKNAEYGEDAWYKTPIKLKEFLGVPIGYHLYNWHCIPFNNDYPHFLPAKDQVMVGMKELKEKGIYIMPYINAKLWDILDREDTDYMFSSVAKPWTVKFEDGRIETEQYASHEKTGELCTLAVMCPSAKVWHDTIADVVKKLFYEVKVDGVYLDQITASPPSPCMDKTHSHKPGGGSWWVESYGEMLDRIRQEKPEWGILTSESNAEAYMKGLDGYLTWLWLHSDSVPAFALLYSRYAVLFGRNTGGVKGDDIPFFKHNIASSLVYGQQIGWINAAVVYDERRRDFLKKVVDARYNHSKLFSEGKLLRPPVTKCDIESFDTTAALPFEGTYTVSHIVSGGWGNEDGKEAYIFVTNIADEVANAEFTITKKDYFIGKGTEIFKECGESEYTIEEKDDKITFKSAMKPNDVMVIAIKN